MGDARVSLLSWNIWHNGPCEPQRIDAISNTILQLGRPDVICFQEVTQVTLEQLSQQSWWGMYHRSRETTRKVRQDEEWYFTVLLLKASTFQLVSYFLEKIFPNTIMGRCLLAVQAEAYGSSFCFACAHLESPGGDRQTKMRLGCARVEQASQSLKFLSSSCSGEVMIAGDMNWIEGDQPAWSLPEGWCDPWEVSMPGDPGYTYDCHRNQMIPWNGYRSRLDRVWCRLKDWVPVHIELVGLSRLKNVRALDNKRVVLPSDHFGIYTVFSRKARPVQQ
ncbi:g9544 [Coccomyxa elongata]